jgi:hypothetical protein
MDLSGTRKDVSHGQGAATANWDSGAATTTNANDLLIGGSLIDGSATATAMTSTPGGRGDRAVRLDQLRRRLGLDGGVPDRVGHRIAEHLGDVGRLGESGVRVRCV